MPKNKHVALINKRIKILCNSFLRFNIPTKREKKGR